MQKMKQKQMRQSAGHETWVVSNGDDGPKNKLVQTKAHKLSLMCVWPSKGSPKIKTLNLEKYVREMCIHSIIILISNYNKC